jgi:hypothetical protein
MNITATRSIASGRSRRTSNLGGWWKIFRWPNAKCAAVVAAILGITGCVATTPTVQDLTAAPEMAVALNDQAPFAAGIVPNRAPPVRIGDEVGFMLSASETGYGHLYLLNASGGVLVLAENLLVAGGAQTAFPTPGSDFVFRASPPAGIERVLFLMTRQPFRGFGAGASSPVQIPVQARDFIMELNAATGQLPGQGWVVAETRVEIVP